MDAACCKHIHWTTSDGYRVCKDCGWCFSRDFKEHNEQEVTKGKHEWKENMFGAEEPACVAVTPAIPPGSKCATCITSRIKKKGVYVGMAEAFCKMKQQVCGADDVVSTTDRDVFVYKLSCVETALEQINDTPLVTDSTDALEGHVEQTRMVRLGSSVKHFLSNANGFGTTAEWLSLSITTEFSNCTTPDEFNKIATEWKLHVQRMRTRLTSRQSYTTALHLTAELLRLYTRSTKAQVSSKKAVDNIKLRRLLNEIQQSLKNVEGVFASAAGKLYEKIERTLETKAGGYNMQHGSLIRHGNELCMHVYKLRNELIDRQTTSFAILYKWSSLGNEWKKGDKYKRCYSPWFRELTEEVREDSFNADALIAKVVPCVFEATHVQTIAEMFLESSDMGELVRIRQQASTGNLNFEELWNVVLHMDDDRFLDAALPFKFKRPGLVTPRSFTGNPNDHARRLRCKGCRGERGPSEQNSRDVRMVWTELALTLMIAVRLSSTGPLTRYLPSEWIEDADEKWSYRHRGRYIEWTGRHVYSSNEIREMCIERCGEAFWRSEFFRIRMLESVTAAAVFVHKDGYFKSTLPDNAVHKISVGCTAATLGFFAIYMEPVIKETVLTGTGTTWDETVRNGSDVVQRARAARDAFLREKGNAEVDTLACMRLVQYVHLVESDKNAILTHQITSADGKTTITVPTLPPTFGSQRSRDGLSELTKETLKQSHGQARYKTERSAISFSTMRSVVAHGYLGTTFMHANEMNTLSLHDTSSSDTMCAPVRVWNDTRYAKVRAYPMRQDRNESVERCHMAYARINSVNSQFFTDANINSVSNTWTVPKLACGLFVVFTDASGRRHTDYKDVHVGTRGRAFENAAWNAIATQAEPVRRSVPVTESEQRERDLKRVDDAVCTLVVGKSDARYFDPVKVRLMEFPTTKMQSRGNRLASFAGTTPNRAIICKCLNGFFSNSSHVDSLGQFLDPKNGYERAEILYKRMKEDFNAAGGAIPQNALTHPEKLSDEHWALLLSAARWGGALHDVLMRADFYFHMPAAMASVVSVLHPISCVLRRCRQLELQLASHYPTGHVIPSIDHMNDLDDAKRAAAETAWELYKSCPENTLDIESSTRTENRLLGLNGDTSEGRGGYISYFATGVLRELLTKEDECKRILASVFTSAGVSPGRLDATYAEIAKLVYECGTDRFYSHMKTMVQYHSIVVDFLCRVACAIERGGTREKAAARLISNSHMCFLTGRKRQHHQSEAVNSIDDAEDGPDPCQNAVDKETDSVEASWAPLAEQPGSKGAA